MQFGLGKQQSTERRVGSQFALWQTLRHNQHAFFEAGVGPHIIHNSLSLSLFSVAIWRIRFAEGNWQTLPNWPKMPQKHIWLAAAGGVAIDHKLLGLPLPLLVVLLLGQC